MIEADKPLRVYAEKMAEMETLSPTQIKEAFDNSHYAVCFNYNRGYGRAIKDLFGAIWKENPNTIITKADLCILACKPIVWCDQLLLIDKNGNGETANTIAKFMNESGIISYEYRVVDEKGLKICFGSLDVQDKHRFKGNLLIDGDKLLLVSRPMTQADKAIISN